VFETSGNSIAIIALVSWPIVTIAIFANLRPQIAALVSIIGGYLLLPTQTSFDLPMFPTLNKFSVPVITVILCLMTMRRRTAQGESEILEGWVPRGWALGLILLSALGVVLTTSTNSDPLRYGPTVLRGMQPYEAMNWLLSTVVMLLPLVVARRLLAAPDGQRLFLVVLCLTGVAYSFLVLYEARMSPQLNRMVYGFFPHSWSQHIRGGGFRPIVFLQHGLWLAIFLSATVLAAFALFRTSPPTQRARYLAAAIWLLVTLVFARSLGALMITLLIVPMILFLPVRLQLLAAASITVIIALYPITRGTGLVPIDRVIAIAESIDPSRAASFGTRLENDEMILEKAMPRQVLGWGMFGRWRVFDERGRDITISDSGWVILFGEGGWVRYLAIYGLLGLPILLLAIRRQKDPVGPETAAIALILTGQLIDTLANDTVTPITWLMAGALWGRLEWQGSKVAQAAAPDILDNRRKGRAMGDSGAPMPSDRPVYTRQTSRIDRTQSPTN
jgi:hypothetical protein